MFYTDTNFVQFLLDRHDLQRCLKIARLFGNNANVAMVLLLSFGSLLTKEEHEQEVISVVPRCVVKAEEAKENIARFKVLREGMYATRSEAKKQLEGLNGAAQELEGARMEATGISKHVAKDEDDVRWVARR